MLEKQHSINLLSITILYLILPIIFFLLFWFQTPYNIFFVFLLILGLWNCFKPQPSAVFEDERLFSKNEILIVALVSLVFAFFAGMGGYTTQQGSLDYSRSNFIFNTLSHKNWPIEIQFSDNQRLNFIYFFGYYLIPSLFGIFSNQQILDFASYLWGSLGINLGLLWFLKYFKLPVWTIFLFLGFGGLSFLGKLIDSSRYTGIDWWAMPLWYTPPSASLHWTPTYVLAAMIQGIAMLWTLERKNILLAFFFLGSSLLWHPFVSLALLPFFIWKIKKEKFMDLFSAKMFALFFSVFLPVLVFYSTKMYPEKLTFLGSIPGALKNYPMFVLLEFGFWAMFLRKEDWARSNVVITILILLIIPLFTLGASFDLCFRASMAPLVFLSGFVISALLKNPTPIRTKAFVLVFSIGLIKTIYVSYADNWNGFTKFKILSPECRQEHRGFINNFTTFTLQYLGSKDANIFSSLMLKSSLSPIKLDKTFEDSKINFQVNSSPIYESKEEDAKAFFSQKIPIFLKINNTRGSRNLVYFSFKIRNTNINPVSVPLQIAKCSISGVHTIIFKTAYEALLDGQFEYFCRLLPKANITWDDKKNFVVPPEGVDLIIATELDKKYYNISLDFDINDTVISTELVKTFTSPFKVENLKVSSLKPEILGAVEIFLK